MEAKQLRTFLTIAELGSFTRSGRRLGLSQSAISQQLGALERELGVKLLIRADSGARPTPPGEALVHYARQVIHKMDEARRILADYEDSGAGVLRIGAGGAVCHHLLPAVLKEFHERYPKLDLHVRSGHTRLTMERLLEGDLDVGVLTLPVSQAKLRITELGRDELVAIVAPSHPWAERKRVHAADFAGEPLLIYERRSQTFHLIEKVLLEVGVFPRIAMEMDHMEAVTEMVRAGLGVAVVPRWAVCAEINSGALVALPIGKNGLSRAWGLGMLAGDYHPQVIKAFVRLCADRLPAVLAV